MMVVMVMIIRFLQSFLFSFTSWKLRKDMLADNFALDYGKRTLLLFGLVAFLLHPVICAH